MPSEAELIDICLSNSELLKYFPYSEWENRWGALEIEGFFGIPDMVLAFGKSSVNNRKYLRTVAFEFKLRNWKKALSQAYKYSAFAQYSYVIILEDNIKPVLKSMELFKKSNIGLISISHTGKLKLLNKPKLKEPYSEQLKNKFNHIVLKELFSLSERKNENSDYKSQWIDFPQNAFGHSFFK